MTAFHAAPYRLACAARGGAYLSMRINACGGRADVSMHAQRQRILPVHCCENGGRQVDVDQAKVRAPAV